MLLLKLTIVPIFIAIITIVGKKWGSKIAGLLTAFPVVAGPIIIFIAIEQGHDFASLASISAVAATSCLLIFGTIYSHVCIHRHWSIAAASALLGWLIWSLMIATASPNLIEAFLISLGILIITPNLLPKIKPTNSPQTRLIDLPFRMLVAALLTYSVTTFASKLGVVWSGILAVFPVIGLVLSVFTHITLGPSHVALFYRGMANGLYSFMTFFTIFSILILNSSLWLSCTLSLLSAIMIQIVVQSIIKLRSQHIR